VCYPKGIKSILGEITPEGYFKIMRFHQAYTIIDGNDFAVFCGNCKEKIYIKKQMDYSITLNYGTI
jgi:hypothetical protein